MKITDIRATTVTVPLEAPLRHSNGAHWGRFVRTIVEVDHRRGADRLGRDGRRRRVRRSARSRAQALPHRPRPAAARAAALEDHEPGRPASTTTACSFTPRSSSPAWTWPASRSTSAPATCSAARCARSARSRATSSTATATSASGYGGEMTPDEMVAHAADLKQRYGFKTHKLKGGHFRPTTTSKSCARSARRLPRRPLASRSQQRVERRGGDPRRPGDRAISSNDYFEDPTWGLEGMRRVRQLDRHSDRDQHRGRQLRAARRTASASKRST